MLLSSSNSSMEKTTQPSIPDVLLPSGKKMPLLGMGTSSYPPVAPETTKNAVLEAIKIGYRHFDTAAVYQTEQPLGEAIIEAISLGLIKSRDELFITSKLWCCDCHKGLVVPAIRKSLQNLKMEYLDLYLIHFPVSLKPGVVNFLEIKDGDVVPFDLISVWEDMEECQNLGLAKAIGVSNFSCKKLASVLSTASIPPAVNQVELNPVWQQKKLLEFCKTKGIIVQAYSPLGAKGTLWGSDKVMDCKLLHEIAERREKSLSQICLRWVYEQGVCVLVKSFNPERMNHNLQIFDWELSLSPEEARRIGEIPKSKASTGDPFISANGPIKTLEELWDGEV